MANEQNLVKWPKGTSGNPKGRPKGVKNWSTIVQTLLADDVLLAKMLESVKNKPAYLSQLPASNAANAIVSTMIMKAIGGDKQAAEWLRRTGFGDKMLHEFDEGFFQTQKLEIEIVKSQNTDERDPESQLPNPE